MAADISALGLKTCYAFKETHIPTSGERRDIHQALGKVIAPAIRDLEYHKLINGFHHTIHKDIDLRLSCEDWPECESTIKELLSIYLISPDLKDWSMPPEKYGGDIGVLLCYNNLESNSRLSLALVELIEETEDKSLTHAQERLCPHQWIHYLFNQFGYLNLDQIIFELNDAFVWLETIVDKYKGNPQVILSVRSIIDDIKKAADRFEKKLP